MYKIRWLPEARQDLLDIRTYISQDSPRMAYSVVEYIIQHIKKLRDNPSMGRIGKVKGTKELVLGSVPYIIPYRISDQFIEILRFFHQSRKWPER